MKRAVFLKGLPCGLALALPAVVSAQTGGVIIGHAADRATGRGLPEARVTIVGTALVASTRDDGAFTIRNVPAGSQTVRAVRIGFGEQERTVQVAAGQTVVVEFLVNPVAVQLQEVVTTASSGALGIGGTRLSRVSDINPDEIENSEVVRGP